MDGTRHLIQKHVDEYQIDVFNYLDKLHKNDIVTMDEDIACLMEKFDFPDKIARAWVFKWMQPRETKQEKV